MRRVITVVAVTALALLAGAGAAAAHVTAQPSTATTVSAATPPASDDGPVTEVVSTITWHGGSITPGGYDDFVVLLDPVPEDADSLVFKAIQTYDNGDVVRWIDTDSGAGHPAPTLSLVAPAREAATPDPFGITGTVVGLVAGAVAALAWRRNRPVR